MNIFSILADADAFGEKFRESLDLNWYDVVAIQRAATGRVLRRESIGGVIFQWSAGQRDADRA